MQKKLHRLGEVLIELVGRLFPGYASCDILRVHVVWQFYIYETDITRIFRLSITKTNIQKFSMLKIVDFVPEAPIPIYYVFVTHICKIFRPKNYR